MKYNEPYYWLYMPTTTTKGMHQKSARLLVNTKIKERKEKKTKKAIAKLNQPRKFISVHLLNKKDK